MGRRRAAEERIGSLPWSPLCSAHMGRNERRANVIREKQIHKHPRVAVAPKGHSFLFSWRSVPAGQPLRGESILFCLGEGRRFFGPCARGAGFENKSRACLAVFHGDFLFLGSIFFLPGLEGVIT